MKIEVSDYYKEQGFNRACIGINGENRKHVSLYNALTKTSKFMSYAKYIYTSHYKVEIPKGYEIDHINNDKTDDRIENLQVLSKKDNIHKSHKIKEMVLLKCPVCGCEFLFEARNLSTHPDPCCSRKCGGIKSHWTLKTKASEQ